MVFKQRVDKVKVCFFITFPVVGVLIPNLIHKMDAWETAMILLIYYLLIALVLIGMYSTQYIVAKDKLIIKKYGKETGIGYYRFDQIKKVRGEKILLLKNGETVVSLFPSDIEEFEKMLLDAKED